MSETSFIHPTQSEQSEDPLPARFEYVIPEPEIPSELGEVVANDLRDPFTWLSHKNGAHPSEAAKNIMWMLYRMSGHFPVKEEYPGRERDDARMDHVSKRINQFDQMFIDDYQKYLVKFDTEEASKRISSELKVVPSEPEYNTMPVLHEPNSELVAMAIRLAAEADNLKDAAA